MPAEGYDWPHQVPAHEGAEDPTSVVVLTDRAGVVAATLRFAGAGMEYTGARGGDIHLRGMLIELFHHRKRAAAQSADKPFHHGWLRSHFHTHLSAIDPDLVAHPPVPGSHPVVQHLLIGSQLPRSFTQRYAGAPG